MPESKTEIKFNYQKLSRVMKFADWDEEKQKIPLSVGIYVVWKGTEFVYVGIAGVQTNKRGSSNKNSKKRLKGLRRRLSKHASGNRGGNMFCVYVSDRFIVPYLNKKEMNELKVGKLKLDGRNGKIKKYIRTHFTYQYLSTENVEDARRLEKTLRKGETSLGKPKLNPSL